MNRTLILSVAFCASFQSFSSASAQNTAPSSDDIRHLKTSIGAIIDFCSSHSDVADCNDLLYRLRNKMSMSSPGSATTTNVPVVGSAGQAPEEAIKKVMSDFESAFKAKFPDWRTFQDTQAAKDTTTADAAAGQGSGTTGKVYPKPSNFSTSMSASSDTKNASLDISVGIADALGGSLSSDFGVQAPISGTDTFQEPATLDGLAKSTAISAQINYVRSHFSIHPELLRETFYQQACVELVSVYVNSTTDTDGARRAALLENPGACLDTALEDIVRADKRLEPSVKTALEDALGSQEAKNTENLHKLTVPQIDSMYIISFNTKIGYNQHVFYDDAGENKTTYDKDNFQVGASLTGVLPARTTRQGDLSATLGFSYQKVYDDGGLNGVQQIICPPSDKGSLKCIQGFIGPPVPITKELLSLDVRYISPAKLFLPFGVDPSATCDWRSGAYGFSVPVYFITDKQNGLSGGIRYDWTSTSHESVVGVFVSSKFCIVPIASMCASSSTGKGGTDKQN